MLMTPEAWADLSDLTSFFLVTPELLGNRVVPLKPILDRIAASPGYQVVNSLPVMIFGQAVDRDATLRPTIVSVGLVILGLYSALFYLAAASQAWQSGPRWEAPLLFLLGGVSALAAGGCIFTWFYEFVRNKNVKTKTFWIGLSLFALTRLVMLSGHAGLFR